MKNFRRDFILFSVTLTQNIFDFSGLNMDKFCISFISNLGMSMDALHGLLQTNGFATPNNSCFNRNMLIDYIREQLFKLPHGVIEIIEALNYGEGG